MRLIKGSFRENAEVIDIAPMFDGLWFMRCMENDYEWEPVAIYTSDDDVLFCDSIESEMPVEILHRGMTNTEWATVSFHNLHLSKNNKTLDTKED